MERVDNNPHFDVTNNVFLRRNRRLRQILFRRTVENETVDNRNSDTYKNPIQTASHFLANALGNAAYKIRHRDDSNDATVQSSKASLEKQRQHTLNSIIHDETFLKFFETLKVEDPQQAIRLSFLFTAAFQIHWHIKKDVGSVINLLTAYEQSEPFPAGVVSRFAKSEGIQSLPSLFSGEPRLLGLLFSMPEFAIYQEEIKQILNVSQKTNSRSMLTGIGLALL